MRVSHETIYQSIYVQGRGALRRELAGEPADRAGAAQAAARRKASGAGRIPDMVNISERPAEAADRAVPGHWEGDLIDRRRPASPRSAPWWSAPPGSRCWCRCRAARRAGGRGGADPGDRGPARRAAPVADLGPGQGDGAAHADRGGRGQRDLLLRPALALAARHATRTPTGCCASTSPRAPTCPCTAPQHLAAVADELNGRPRKTLGWKTPAEALAEILDSQAA